MGWGGSWSDPALARPICRRVGGWSAIVPPPIAWALRVLGSVLLHNMKIMAAEYGFQGFVAEVNSLVVDSTGNLRGCMTYTLTAGEEKVDLSKKNIGSASQSHILL